ncbi:MAG: YbaB/EbfC family nucleoid-associated protein [Alphaproteobacteria bacterium]|uniref:YbaB/EbfC family nucleoid-associated protein n=1 Tax=Futiania mangrovi TaxID=2959716 RepID=UPI0022B05E45|nr:YbaB/EbfC family nucleoid-associated protein [Futiania mangrovii]MDX5361680.1 YbaB/EbfC family nucleoid-associated protein [Alphaproteobacteria bacterium]MDX5369861.1 YbaB/EbfC family nucleoid-associated protein [Alphaproteobacteria bacterium]MDX5464477.1 YbaB/EbfC family nucleoid-associated protein [Alphaproteobacteria bacterium]
MIKGLGDLTGLMKQAQEMQEKMQAAQERLAGIEVEGSAGAGLVTVVATAKGEVRRVSIDPSLMTADDREVLEDLVVAAVNDARAKAEVRAQEEMQQVTAGLPLPPGFKLPF